MFEWAIYFIKSIFKKPFKIGLISYYYPEDFSKTNSGVAVHSYYLSRELTKLGCEVHVFSKWDKNKIKKEYIGDGKLVIHRINPEFDCPISDSVMKKRMSYFIFDNKIINEITKEDARRKFDIIHTHGWLTAGAFISKYLNDVKWIHTFHAVEKNRLRFMSKDEKKYFKIARWVESTINYADALVVVSQALKKEVLNSYPVKEDKISYIPNGVDISLFHPENSLTNDKTILYIGRFSLEKGINLIPKIAKEVLEKNKEARFVIVAADSKIPSFGKIEKGFDELAKKYKERFVIYNSYVNREELARLYNKSIIYLQPSVYESFGLCVLEAMACGKAVIVSNRGGLPEVVGNAGLIVPLNDRAFSKQILRLLEDYRLRERYGRRAVERAKLFVWEKIALKTLDLYKKISFKQSKQI